MAKSYHVNTFDLAPDEARAIWHEITDGTYELNPEGSASSNYKFSTRIWFASDILFSRVRAEANTIIRSSKLVERHPTKFVKVKMLKAGKATIQLDAEEFHLDHNALYFIDQNRSKRETYTDHELVSIFLPYQVLGYDPLIHPPVLGLRLDSALGHFLSASIDVAYQELTNLKQNELSVLSESFSGMLRGVFAHGTEAAKYPSIRSNKVNDIRNFIEKNLNHSRLGTDTICQEFNLSRATLFRHLADLGGVNRYILSRRLNRAYRDLSEAQPVRGVVKAIADRWGFSSQAYFSRVFKEEFNVSPASLVGRWAQKPHDAAATDNANQQGNISHYSTDIAALKWAYERYR